MPGVCWKYKILGLCIRKGPKVLTQSVWGSTVCCRNGVLPGNGKSKTGMLAELTQGTGGTVSSWAVLNDLVTDPNYLSERILVGEG